MKSNVDAVTIRDNRLFAYGWVFASSAPIVDMRLQIRLVDGATTSVPLTWGKEREDVAQVFPHEPHARRSGWMAYAAWLGSNATSLALAGRLEDGSSFIQPVRELGIPAPGPRSANWFGRAKSGIRSLVRPAPAAPTGASPPIDLPARAIELVRAALVTAGQSACSLAIDHDMGGGANHFRHEWCKEQRARRPVLLLLSFEIASLRYLLDIDSHSGTQRLFFEDDALVEALYQAHLVDEVFYNDAVSFPRPELVPQWLAGFKKTSGLRLSIAIHDYFAVCPSQFLLNDSGSFCRVPELAECQRCLPVNDQEFSSLFEKRSIVQWRQLWGKALMMADDIVCFSRSSVDLLLRAYPQLVDAPLRVQPHAIAPFPRAARVDMTAPLHIGVVGAIGVHKGAGVLQALAKEIAVRGLDIRITVIGSVELPCDAGVLRATGPFVRADLPALIENSGANLFLLPSICPETFSYVTQELMTLDLPLACFDFGAPAERVGAYPMGLVTAWNGAGPLLHDLQHFHRRLQAATQEPS